METTYTMIGADGLQYGPITLDQLRAWVGEGRVTGDTRILRSDTKAWLQASQYVELGLPQVATASPPPLSTSPAMMADPALERRARLGARWFFWIAGLSLVNTFMAMSRKGVVFVVGLGVTRFIDAFGRQAGGDGTIALVINVLIAGLFALFGVFAFKRQSWSFIVGMVLYAMDALLAYMVSGWLGLGFHLFVLFWIFQGLQACFRLNSQAR
ncbi:MAG: hypothetical protein JWQ04_226 [Pedosphaera sp.]|nr:hypothetical protein [Pedosphaera sp.]